MVAPTPDAPHWTLKPDRNCKGSYYRRLDDIKKGLKRIDSSSLPPGGRFLFLYYGCEKLGKGIVGIAQQWPAEEAYEKRGLQLGELKAAVKSIGLSVPDTELDALFASTDKTTARYWRNEIVHNFGPTNVENVIKHSLELNRRMHDFLENWNPAVLRYLSRTYAHLF
jgi:hypothetical protein